MKAVCFGETLFDVFPTGAVLGGAPLNVCRHLKRLGADAWMISAVGKDELGRHALGEIAASGLPTSTIRTAPAWPTSVADITLNEKGDASYEFNRPSAMDRITLTPEAREIGKLDLLYFGSLAMRPGSFSRRALEKLLETSEPGRVFFDVNIRKDNWKARNIKWGLDVCDILKVNEEEAPLIAGVAELSIEHSGLAKGLRDKYGIGIMLITKGKKGATIYVDGEEVHTALPDLSVPVVDTVGAGDSLSAGFLAALHATGDPAVSLDFGSRLADYVVSKRGACPEYDDSILCAMKEMRL